MTLAEKLEQVWRTLEVDRSGTGLVRSLADFGVPDARMLLAIDEGCREIMFPASDDFTLASFPRVRGVKVVLRTHSDGATSQRYLVLRCTRGDFHAVFRRFAGAVMEQVSNSGDPASAASVAIRSWLEMFDRAGEDREAALLGVFGELYELLGLVRRNPRALATWTGPDARPQDFTNGALALEVKTSRALASEVEIHGLEQLWRSPFEHLVLSVKQVVKDTAGQRLRDLVDQIHACGVPKEALLERLEHFDLDTNQLESPEMPRFAHRGSRYFVVGEGAPAVTPDHFKGPIPSGVSRLRYRATLDHQGLLLMSTQAADVFLSRMADC